METNVKDRPVDRRRFLTLLAQGSVAAAAIAAVGQVVRFLSYQPPNSASNILPVGQPGSFSSSSLVYVAGARVYVGRDRSGLYAMDAVCTHLGCLVELAEEGGFVCPCHDSRFDAQGRPQAGPATKPLRYLHLWLDPEEGQLLVDRDKPVEATARLAL
jgi:cytochrome b6-f complex iron-sulfur subunit